MDLGYKKPSKPRPQRRRSRSPRRTPAGPASGGKTSEGTATIKILDKLDEAIHKLLTTERERSQQEPTTPPGTPTSVRPATPKVLTEAISRVNEDIQQQLRRPTIPTRPRKTQRFSPLKTRGAKGRTTPDPWEKGGSPWPDPEAVNPAPPVEEPEPLESDDPPLPALDSDVPWSAVMDALNDTPPRKLTAPVQPVAGPAPSPSSEPWSPVSPHSTSATRGSGPSMPKEDEAPRRVRKRKKRMGTRAVPKYLSSSSSSRQEDRKRTRALRARASSSTETASEQGPSRPTRKAVVQTPKNKPNQGRPPPPGGGGGGPGKRPKLPAVGRKRTFQEQQEGESTDFSVRLSKPRRKRVTKAPRRFSDYHLYSDKGDPEWEDYEGESDPFP